MPKYDDFNLDIQNATSEDKEPTFKSCWGCLSRLIPCEETLNPKEN